MMRGGRMPSPTKGVSRMYPAALVLGLLAAAPEPEPIELNTRSFEVPVATRPDRRAEVKELLLYVSDDQGKTWRLAERITPDRTGFVFTAPKDGVYWFSVAIIDKQGRQDPADVSKEPPGQKVLVRTAGKPAAPG